MAERRQAGGGRSRGALAAAVVLALVGVALLGYAWSRQEPAPPAPARSAATHEPTPTHTGKPTHQAGPSRRSGPSRKAGQPPSTRAPSGDSYERPTGPIMDASEPVRINIPALHVSSAIIRLGLNSDGTMQVPPGPGRAGWYVHGPTPGELGPAVIAAHVTWNRRPDVFFKLGAAKPGDKVKVSRRDGSTAVFEITRVAQYAKKDFPTQAVYGTTDHAALRLITCGGVFDGENNRYLDNVVAYAKLLPGPSAHH